MTNEKLITGCWRHQSCFVVGGGPSLRGFNFDRLKGWLTIGVNRAFEFFTPTILLALDARFYQWVREGKYGDDAFVKLARYKGVRVGVNIHRNHSPGTLEVKSLGERGPIVPIEQGLYHGNNSGYSAIALALALGANPVYVIGIDLRYDGEVTHHHDGHPERTAEKNLFDRCILPFIELSERIEGKRVKIVNPCWPGDVFSKVGGLFEVVPFPEKP